MVSLEQFLNPHGRDHGPLVPKMTPRDENIVTKTPYPKFEQNRTRNAGDMSCWSSYQLGGADQGLGSENKIIAHPSGE